jgi:hypothetical protein
MGWCITSGLVALPSSAYFGGQSFTVRAAKTVATGNPLFLSVWSSYASLGLSRLGYNHAHELRLITSADVDNAKSKAYSENLLRLAKL